MNPTTNAIKHLALAGQTDIGSSSFVDQHNALVDQAYKEALIELEKELSQLLDALRNARELLKFAGIRAEMKANGWMDKSGNSPLYAQIQAAIALAEGVGQ